MIYTRNLSPQKMFLEMARKHRPEFSFEPDVNFTEWKCNAWPQVLKTLGDFPEKVAPEPEKVVEWCENGVHKETWLINVAPGIAAEIIVAHPENLPAGERRPAILCCHGHGPYGKDAVMGNASSPERQSVTARANYDYGHQMAQNGYVTYAIDWIGFGARNDGGKPYFLSQNGARDWCNLYYLHATMLGMTSLSINLGHGMAATDFVTTLPYVEPEKLGVMGLSGGGTMALWFGLVDSRIKATEIICYSAMWADFGINDVNYCGMQVAPGLLKLVDLPDLQGLLAPRPLLVDIGIYDTCFPVESAMRCFHKVEKIYQAADASENLELDLFPGEHSWGGNRSNSFFKQHFEVKTTG